MKKKIIFFSIPAAGHINPVLPVIKELVDRGNHVICYCTKEYVSKFQFTGAEIRIYPYFDLPDLAVIKIGAVFMEKMLDAAEIILHELPEEIKKEKPDIILHDSLALWGKLFAKKFSIKGVSLITTIAFNTSLAITYPSFLRAIVHITLRDRKKFIVLIKRYFSLLRQFGIQETSFISALVNKEPCNIVFTSRLFQPNEKTFRKTFHFVGSAISQRPEETAWIEKLPTDKKIIYISLGTIYNNDLHFFATCINAFTQKPYTVVLSLGHRFTAHDLPRIPHNIIVKNHVPQLAILQKASLFISHGGMNSISESLYFGVPLLMFPQIEEQELNATRVVQLGAGKILPQHITAKNLYVLAENTLANTSFLRNAQKVQQSLQRAGGYEKAVDLILSQ